MISNAIGNADYVTCELQVDMLSKQAMNLCRHS